MVAAAEAVAVALTGAMRQIQPEYLVQVVMGMAVLEELLLSAVQVQPGLAVAVLEVLEALILSAVRAVRVVIGMHRMALEVAVVVPPDTALQAKMAVPVDHMVAVAVAVAAAVPVPGRVERDRRGL
jgi:hypothetical protein